MSAAKSEISARQTANALKNKEGTISWHDATNYERSGSYKDYGDYVANTYKAKRLDAIRSANFAKSMYNSSLLGKGEKIVKDLLSIFKKK